MTEPGAESKLAIVEDAADFARDRLFPCRLIRDRRAARAALLEAPKGELEIGGVLFGEYDARAIHIDTWRPIDCEHAEGPIFTSPAAIAWSWPV